jgi:uncharacterized membrane protein YphA (DoxX/SURF4 family)
MPDPLRAAARLLTGSTYAVLGYDAWRAPGGRVDLAADTIAALRRVVPLPDDETVVRGNAAVQTVAGTTLALGVLPRMSALALLCSMVPTTVAGHGFWTVDDPTARKAQRVQFHKNLAMLGGLLLVVRDRAD